MSRDRVRSGAWFRATLLLGLLYLVIGRVFALPTDHARAWRLAAWAISGIAFSAHIGYEHFRLRDTPGVTAVHVALAVAIGAAGLAIAGLAHSLSTASGLRPAWILAIVLWPAITAIPAFLVALVVSTTLTRLAR
jgi:hypothetical protein